MVKASQVREKYLQFFAKLGHKVISPAPLVPENDPTTLFTSSGMQPLVPYLMGEPHPEGKRLVDVQPSIRTVDIDEVGDNRHLTFFEMLGNWSLGDYFKKEQIPWIWEFFTRELGLEAKRLYVSVFGGFELVPRDEESAKIWRSIGVPEHRIFYYGVSKNWWSRSGPPAQMPANEIGGPDSEVFYDFGENLRLHENSPWRNEECHPNCECGRFLEIGNNVFIQYKKLENGSLEELPQRNVDFGGGLERILAALDGNPDVFRTELFYPIIASIGKETGKGYGGDEKLDRHYRVVADHLKAASLLMASGVLPANRLQGYVLRRLIRRSIFHLREMGVGVAGAVLSHLIESLKEVYEEVGKNWEVIDETLLGEGLKFKNTLDRGLGRLRRLIAEKGSVSGRDAFDLYQSDGFPLELTLEILRDAGIDLSDGERGEFESEFAKHRELSRTASAGIFRGGLADHSQEVIRLHTATHLLHAALRRVLGDHVSQRGSNITQERLRFDFTHPRKLTRAEVEEVEKLVNKQIEKDLPVSFETKTFQEARAEGALANFAEKYGEKVKVYTIGDFSREVCGGPHVKRLSELGGRVKIYREEPSGLGVRRIYAQILLDANN